MIDFSKVGVKPATQFEFEPARAVELPDGKSWPKPNPAPPPISPRNIRLELEAEGLDPGSVVDLDIPGAKRALAIFDDQAARMEAEVNAVVVNSDATASQATEMTGQVKRLAKAVDDRRKEIIAEPDSFVRKVNGFVKPISDRLKALEAALKKKLGDYAYQQELQRREIERRQREEQEKLQKQIDAEAKARGVESVTVAPVAVQPKQGPTRSEGAVASTVLVWDFEVEDDTKVPRVYLMVDEKLIREAIRGGIRDIPGVRIFERAEMRVRRVG